MEKREKNGMIERAIENWLTNTNELNFQTAFCQTLIIEGHTLLRFPSHDSFEEGKDIITKDKNGKYCAYQLKSGKIDVADWRKIEGEIRELIEQPIHYPTFDKTKEIYKAFLVTNGRVTSPVINRITKTNENNRRQGYNYPALEIVEVDELIERFVKAQGNFLPKELKDFNNFLKLFLVDGHDFLPKNQFFRFLNELFFDEKFRWKSNKINAINSSLILLSYLLNPFQHEKNYYALFEAWTGLSANIIQYAKSSNLSRKDWDISIKLIISEISCVLNQLKEEIMQKKTFFEGNIIGDNKTMYGIRAVIVLGTLATFEIYKYFNEEDYGIDEDLVDLIKNNLDKMVFWGESAFPYYFNLIKYLEISNSNKESYFLLENLFLTIINKNFPNTNSAFPNPYYDVTSAIENLLKRDIERNKEIDNRFNFLEDPKMDIENAFKKDINEVRLDIFLAEQKKNEIDKTLSFISDNMNWKEIPLNQFSGSSYILKSLTLMLVRRNQRSLLEKNWHKMSYIRFEEFKPDNTEDIFSWRTNKGVNITQEPNQPQKWADLVDESKLDTIPPLLKENIDIIRFFILVCPQRATPEIITLLDF